jgi:hypothetical protein
MLGDCPDWNKPFRERHSLRERYDEPVPEIHQHPPGSYHNDIHVMLDHCPMEDRVLSFVLVDFHEWIGDFPRAHRCPDSNRLLAREEEKP